MKLYYRHRENGVTVFRMEVANRQRRIELNQIATLRNGEVLPHKRRPPTEAEMTEIKAWDTAHVAKRDADDFDESERFIEQLNLFTDWVARKAPGEQIDDQSDALLTALLDLRQVVVRRLSEAADDSED